MEKPLHPNMQVKPVLPDGKNHPDRNGKPVIGYDYIREAGKPGRRIYYFADGTDEVVDDSGNVLQKWS